MSSENILSTIRRKYDTLTKMQQKIADYILKNSQKVIRMSISELAEATKNKSESSIVRFYRVLGFGGYHDFKVALATEIAGKSFYHTYSELTKNDSIKDVKTKIYNGIVKTLHENFNILRDELLENTVDLILQANRVIFLGYGQSGNICENACFKFTRIGINCIYSSDSHFNSILFSELKEDDLIFCISYSGITKDILIPIEKYKHVVKIIAMTGSSNSPLGKLADICITSLTEELNYRTDAIIVRHVQNMILDILYIHAAIKIGEPALSRLEKSKQSISYLKL